MSTETLEGGKGDDTLIGDDGADRLDGGEGNDTASYYLAEQSPGDGQGGQQTPPDTAVNAGLQ